MLYKIFRAKIDYVRTVILHPSSKTHLLILRKIDILFETLLQNREIDKLVIRDYHVHISQPRSY